MSDDITFCMSECDITECFRHPSNIIDKTIPHSFSFFRGTQTCFSATLEIMSKEEEKRDMNNKKLGTEFEKQMVDLLSKKGYWVHFLSPDVRGTQPFDVIAVKDGVAAAIDCKTCKNRYFHMRRLEQNQVMAFEKWLACGNATPFIAVLHNDKIYMIDYLTLKEKGRVDLEEEEDVQF